MYLGSWFWYMLHFYCSFSPLNLLFVPIFISTAFTETFLPLVYWFLFPLISWGLFPFSKSFTLPPLQEIPLCFLSKFFTHSLIWTVLIPLFFTAISLHLSSCAHLHSLFASFKKLISPPHSKINTSFRLPCLQLSWRETACYLFLVKWQKKKTADHHYTSNSEGSVWGRGEGEEYELRGLHFPINCVQKWLSNREPLERNATKNFSIQLQETFMSAVAENLISHSSCYY